VFRWDGHGKDVCISGSYDNWETKIPLVRRLLSIIESVMYHSYKDLVRLICRFTAISLQCFDTVGCATGRTFDL